MDVRYRYDPAGRRGGVDRAGRSTRRLLRRFTARIPAE
ncbi:hypothetical protein E1298_26840 [Actinomadura rubrisoli]|uniref:Uncharacterized protein n=1 Tax=Actinomadura rubrisoli TaxID=2530368 RepID=A0A4R5B3Y0_9ACTN|nr:hypothetical protein E1298_26840 [Actinomadura rubrisoli]